MRRKTEVPTLLAISDRRLCGGASGLEHWARSLPDGAAVQLREKDLDPIVRTEIGRTLREAVSGLLIVNGSLEVAVDCRADGVHLRSDQRWAEAAPSIRARGLLLGVSTHSRRELEAAVLAGADYALFGPVFASPEKLRFGAPQGVERLKWAARGPVPILAVGGVDPSNAPDLVRAGAHGVAAIRAFAAPDTAAALARAWASATGTLPPS
ncbi:MAG: thiamine phosphate synthase [Acidobacteria bacterium]|nr:thiamine phosphate synthase [Acidobacteriota bacterium]